MKTQYKSIKFKPESMALITACAAVIVRYQKQRLRLTLRQLYYQLVTQNIVTNTERSYKNLGNLVSDARLAGLLDWDAIEDRGREPLPPPQFDSLADLIDAAVSSYRLPRWRTQKYYAELWVEKQALAGVLQPLAREHHVVLMVNKGYSSQSAMHESALRFIKNCSDTTDGGVCEGHEERSGILFYLGDHDPSGEDMVRDIRDRLAMFGAEVAVQKLALTMDQIEQYDPPPNPAKVTDSRAAAYIAKYGDSSWEVDALDPATLSQIIRDAFKAIIDQDAMDVILDIEVADKNRLVGLTDSEK